MAYTKVPYLCGGVLLLLLEQTKPGKGTARDHAKGIPEKHPNPDVLRDLIYVFTGSKDYSAKKDCSEYSNCLTEGSVNVPFNDAAIISAFNTTVLTNYSVALDRMKWFVDTRINEAPDIRHWLVMALLDVIEHDEMPDDTLFFCCEDGSTATKNDLMKADTLCFDSFLLGILHFILQYRSGKNENGQATLAAYAEKRGNGRTYVGTLGDSINRTILLTRYEPLVELSENLQHDDIDIEEDVDAEYVNLDNSMPENKAADPQQNITIIQNQTNIEHNETNTFNIENSVVSFDLRRK